MHCKYYHYRDCTFNSTTGLLTSARGISVPGVSKLSKKVAQTISDATVCVIYRDNNEVIAFGAAYCTKQDNFCKKTGRLISLAKALGQAKEEGSMTRAERCSLTKQSQHATEQS